MIRYESNAHAPHVAIRVPSCGTETKGPRDMVNGGGDGAETVSQPDIYTRLVDACDRHSVPHSRVGKLAGVYRNVMRELSMGNPILGRTRARLEDFLRSLEVNPTVDKSAALWSQRDDETLRRLWNSGLHDDVALADALGRSPRGIRMRRHRLDLKFSAQEIAKKRTAIIQAAKPTRDWPAADDRRLAELLRDGLTSKEIAAKLGRTESAVFHRRQIVKPTAYPKTKSTSHYDREVSFQEENSQRVSARMGSAALAKAVSAIVVPTPTPKRKRTFEELLAAVEAGEVRVTERPVMRAPDPVRTMGGVVGDYSI